ncbi:MAG: hypothetical protein HYY37_04280 [Candidatus Aenigmarchaeota archaeon]|nr:hypothetical protein [Candidatus Aenigmarchaeota archaeon]
MALSFVWFFWALSVTISNIVYGIIVYHFLKKRRARKNDLEMLRDISIYYILGLMFAIISSSLLLIVVNG